VSAKRDDTPYAITDLTVVLGPPNGDRSAFDDFQSSAHEGQAVVDHAWANHEYAALDALTHRNGTIATHTILETMLGSVLQVATLCADVERQWVRHADGLLYASLTISSEDVRPRAAGLALHDPALVDALNGVAGTISALDGRAWITWSSRTWHDGAEASSVDTLRRAAALVGEMAALVIGDSPLGSLRSEDSDAAPVPLVEELLVAVRHGRAHAERPSLPLTRELRALRHRDPMRAEWTRITMDAYYLAALDPATVRERIGGSEGEALQGAGLAYLFLGAERTARLKADPDVTPRFRGELAAKTFMTAYALERLAPRVSATFAALMDTPPSQR
jgi:hypothetical protein